MRFITFLLLSSATGFLALAQEIIWVRIMMYYTGGRPEVFAYVLGSYLTGIAIGSWWTRKLCSQKIGSILISRMLFLSCIVFYLSIGSISYFHTLFTGPIIYILVILVTVFSGTIFPLLAHFGIKTEQVGQRLSWIYLANIIGWYRDHWFLFNGKLLYHPDHCFRFYCRLNPLFIRFFVQPRIKTTAWIYCYYRAHFYICSAMA